MNGQAATLSDRANGFKGMLVLPGARFDVHHHVGGDNLADALFYRFAGGVGLLEACSARNADGCIHKIALACPAHANAFGTQDAFGFIQSLP